MPAAGHISPQKLPAQIRQWLTDHPGEHRARDVAEGLGLPDGMKRADWSQKVANALGRLSREGAVTRRDRDLENHKRPVGFYSIPA